MNIGPDNSRRAKTRAGLGVLHVTTFMLSLPSNVGRISNVGGFDEPFVGQLKMFNAPVLGRNGDSRGRHNGNSLGWLREGEM